MTAAHRVGTTTFITPSDLEIVATRVFHAPRQLVWDAHTRPEHVSKWMLGPDGWTMPVCEIDLRPGGAYHFVWRRADGSEMNMRGIYREVVPPERLVNTESWGEGWPETVNTLTLNEDGGMTTLTSQVLYSSKEMRDKAYQSGMTDGMSTSYDRLADYLRSQR